MLSPAVGGGGAVLPLNNGLTLQYNPAQDDNIITFISFTNFPYQIQNIIITQRHTQYQSQIGHRVLYNLGQ